MATAGLVVRLAPNADNLTLLRAIDGIAAIEPVPNDPNCFAVVYECPAEYLKKRLEIISGFPFVLSLDIASIDYEEDIEKNGEIPPMSLKSSGFKECK